MVVLAAGGACGPGAGTLTCLSGFGGSRLQWQAPGSITAGQPQSVPFDGQYLLEDGTAGSGAAAYLRVQVYADYLSPGAQQLVRLLDDYNTLGPADVDAVDALAGQTVTTQYSLVNQSGNDVTNVVLWLDSADAGLSVSSDGVNFYVPTSAADPHALTWAKITMLGSLSDPTVYVQRVIGAGAAAAASILNLIQYQWVGM